MSGEISPELDPRALKEALGEAHRIFPLQPERGWLRAIRTSLGLSQAHVAAKASMTRQAYADLEAAEERGAISLNSLRRAAAAMDAEFAYFVTPGTKAPAASAPQSRVDASDDGLPVELR